jgi:predicted aspartyl protease
MITGMVNEAFEPIIPLSICRADGKVYTQDAVVDTGFNGWLSLPPDLIAQLNLKWKRRGRAILGDGSECVFNIYEAVLVWDGNLLSSTLSIVSNEDLIRSIICGLGILPGIKQPRRLFHII